MLSYQHRYHVGNHGDVLKHLSWVSVIQYLNEKDKPYALIDSHAGEGVYSHELDEAHESNQGVDLLNSVNASSGDVSTYLSILNKFKNNNQLPGSPAVAAELMREYDEMHCIELHPQANQLLKQFVKSSNMRISCHKRDAFEGLKALVPPKLKRGAVLIDPPYEQLQEYQLVKETITEVTKRWPNGQLLVWIPLLGRRSPQKGKAAEALIHSLQQLKTEKCDVVTCKLSTKEKTAQEGMYGSALIAINASWKFKESMSKSLSCASDIMGPLYTWSVE
ncbi:23S rRNA (adenine(2030)-N(6))-methyltransferase RlmJ [Alteromonas sp. 5E99-2]|uniref:23S rRNA (adenine(2030)-N(6))-methyltransferase RlmJ n=1 Tax=Alteromonas sp. 5E99-2 TaxID=2817683 RepID=UPI001A99E184|nr:23S rRNA (adenine(2030)-N(6))-methyltransferase RlmJ [Alteromonas sp. 5E99-2]MBO1255042.1 23S rRNA (adenine(2030)-N(6))-methyltransferase RlmJ [Alteromonas sp. 5E99-2]